MKASCFPDNTEMKTPRQRARIIWKKMWQKCGISCLKRQDLERIGKNGKKIGDLILNSNLRVFIR